MPATASPLLFTPFRIGNLALSHRIVLAPLTRMRADAHHVPLDIVAEYYGQRASTPGTLLITEATVVGAKAAGYPGVPGIWNEDQVAAWKKVAEAVHARGSYIYQQLWSLGRKAEISALAADDPSFPYVSASAVKLADKDVTPRALTIEEIHEYVQFYGNAAKNAVHGAGMDGVELHLANGYLMDQFLQDSSNKRTDEYGGSIENKCRFALEVLGAVVAAVGESRVGIRISPWTTANESGMPNPLPTFTYLISEARKRYPDLSHLHVIQPRVNCDDDNKDKVPFVVPESNDFARDLWRPKPLIIAGGFTAESAQKQAEEHGDLVAIGRYFISNPDLPRRIKEGTKFNRYDRATFYTSENTVEAREGYTDYPFVRDSAPSVAA